MTKIISIRDEEIIRLFTETPTLKFSDVGRIYNISRERVRQIVNKYGIKKLKLKDVPKVKSVLQILRESGKNWCSRCKAQDVPLMKKSKNKKINKQYYLCRGCQSDIMNKYYHTESGNIAIKSAKEKYNNK